MMYVYTLFYIVYICSLVDKWLIVAKVGIDILQYCHTTSVYTFRGEGGVCEKRRTMFHFAMSDNLYVILYLLTHLMPISPV